MKEPITAIGIIADINQRFARDGNNLSGGVESGHAQETGNSLKSGTSARKAMNSWSDAQPAQNHSGLEQTPPVFDPALYEEPTGLQQCLEMIERKYGLPRRAK